MFTDPFGLELRFTGEKLRGVAATLRGLSPTFDRMFRAMVLAPARQLNVRVTGCSDPGAGCRMKDWMDGTYYGFPPPAPSLVRMNDIKPDEQLMAILAHELVHAATASGDPSETGVGCKEGEGFQDCAVRIEQQIRNEAGMSASKDDSEGQDK